MTAVAIITEAAEHGVSIALKGDKLALKAATKPSADLLTRLQEHKAEIVVFLRDGARVEPERAAIDGSVPAAVYADTWAIFNCQKPTLVSDAQWQQALDDAGRFLDEWGGLAFGFDWSPGDIFDVPVEGKMAGLIWWARGESVRALGPEHAVTASGRIFDRVTRAEWQNPYAREC